ncbi:hypothetical protein RU97_GL002060 [Enterococcus canis]|uniref:LysM domain-containing protein n=1 Tax=Enterococcus canis TaxID=214095 RepID=A0A1L8RE13_9ENTE|nr:hypothetical protein RU97_GL002060 [Enterococcus canis]
MTAVASSAADPQLTPAEQTEKIATEAAQQVPTDATAESAQPKVTEKVQQESAKKKSETTQKAEVTEEQTKETTYIVKSEDNLWSIARRHNVSVERLMQMNQLQDSRLYPQQQLLIP